MVWNWLMSLPMGKPSLEFTHPNGAPWTSALDLEDSTPSPRTNSDLQERARDGQLEGEEWRSANGLANLWRIAWKWLMSIPMGRFTLAFPRPDGAPWTSLLLLEDSKSSLNKSSNFQEKARDGQLESEERRSMTSGAIEGFTSQSSQIRSEEQTSVSANDAESVDTSAKMPSKRSSALSEVASQVYSQCPFHKDATPHFIYCASHSPRAKMSLVRSSAFSEPIPPLDPQRCACHSSYSSRTSQQSPGRQTQARWGYLERIESIRAKADKRRIRYWGSEK